MSTRTPEPTLSILERLQGQLPPYLARRGLAELAVLMRYAQGSTWAFAIYNTVPVRDQVAEVLRELLHPIPVYECTLSADAPDPLAHLARLPDPHKRAVVFFFDLEQTGGAAWKYMETQRENLAAYPLGLVFWINPQAWRQGVRNAPNFWAQRSGVFDFRIESPAVLSDVRGTWAGQPVRIESREDWERQLRLFSGLLREYEAEKGPATARAELYGKIGYLMYFDGQFDEARQHLEAQLALAQEAGDRRQQADALNNLGRIVQRQQGRLAALEWFERALDVAGDDPGSRAASLQNIARVLYLEGESDRSLTMLNEALALFRAVGDRLGEANTLKAIGHVQQFRDERDAALDSYQQALALFRAVGSRLGEANTLKAIGDAMLGYGETEAALSHYEQAMTLYRQIGDRVGQTNVNWTLGNWLTHNGHYEQALPLLEEALAFVVAIQHPVAPAWSERVHQVRQRLSNPK